MNQKRALLVHAHPDDETINNGATMAKMVSEGVAVTLVTCTRGEEGEVLVPELAHLASSADDKLGEHRVTELANAMKELGFDRDRFRSWWCRLNSLASRGVFEDGSFDSWWSQRNEVDR